MAPVMTSSRRLVSVGALVLLAMPAAGQDVAPQADGAALFKTYCAMCHDGPAVDAQAPRLDTLRQWGAEQVLGRRLVPPIFGKLLLDLETRGARAALRGQHRAKWIFGALLVVRQLP